MTLEEKLEIIDRTNGLIRRKATGTPAELAIKLKQSERFVYQLIKLMKNMDAPIYYCHEKRSYCYEYEVEFSVGFIKKQPDISKIRGGNEKKIKLFRPLHEFCSDTSYFRP
jgi:hypothetical protein